MDDTIEIRRIATRVDAQTFEMFESFLRSLRDKQGEILTKEQVIEFLIGFAMNMKPKEFLALYHAHKAEKFSKD